MRKTAFAVAVLLLLTTSLVLAMPVRADHIFEAAIVDPPIFILGAPAGNRIGILGPCNFGITDVNFPASTGFFVAHGWSQLAWNNTTWLEKRAFVSPASTFAVSIDGVLQPAVMHTALVPTPDGQFFLKFFVSENGQGLTGVHVFVGRWYYDASDPSIGGAFGQAVLMRTCTVTVHFVP